MPVIETEKELLEEKVQILELQCDAAKERVITLEKENEELKETNDRLIEEIQTGMIYRELQEEIAELKAKIEKLKDCKNCSHSENNFCKQRKIFLSNNIAQGCKYWEMYK